MKTSCLEDKEVHQLLHRKKDILSLIQSGGLDSKVLRERTNELRNLKRQDKSGSTWVN
jgi:uncharacterized protein (UPF0335 family)